VARAIEVRLIKTVLVSPDDLKDYLEGRSDTVEEQLKLFDSLYRESELLSSLPAAQQLRASLELMVETNKEKLEFFVTP